jgi:hypothetical protein
MYRIIILPVVLYGCKNRSLTLRKERRPRVFENMMLRRIFVPKMDEITGEWRKLKIEEFDDIYCSPNIIPVIKSRRMRWAKHVARMGRGKAYIEFWWGNLKERDHLGQPGLNGGIILRWTFRKWHVRGLLNPVGSG